MLMFNAKHSLESVRSNYSNTAQHSMFEVIGGIQRHDGSTMLLSLLQLIAPRVFTIMHLAQY